ncbi:MAG: NAD(P)H-dependent oxidoreductase [Hydrococcus sp. Prado102]|jgi:NAD(P)H-dependent FMN reductase|nr:NAD(P)H-dependent oxidoreductase [Hydrococcus sp. Prado102]
MIKILAISGSLRANSSNTAILRAAIGLAPDNLNISLYNRLGDLPHFNPELDGDNSPESVKDWRTQLKETALALKSLQINSMIHFKTFVKYRDRIMTVLF